MSRPTDNTKGFNDTFESFCSMCGYPTVDKGASTYCSACGEFVSPVWCNENGEEVLRPLAFVDFDDDTTNNY